MYYFSFSWCLNYRNTKNSCILQVRYEPHLFEKVRCFEATWFAITKIWYVCVKHSNFFRTYLFE